MSGGSVKRLMREYKNCQEKPVREFLCYPLEDNLFEWHFTLMGPPDSPYANGFYHGRILIPTTYPFAPPDVMLLTPNGRFELEKRICLSISSYHPENWHPTWGITTVLHALREFMLTPGNNAIGAIDYSPDRKRQLAEESIGFVCKECKQCNSDHKKKLLESPPATEQDRKGENPIATPDLKARPDVSPKSVPQTPVLAPQSPAPSPQSPPPTVEGTEAQAETNPQPAPAMEQPPAAEVREPARAPDAPAALPAVPVRRAVARGPRPGEIRISVSILDRMLSALAMIIVCLLFKKLVNNWEVVQDYIIQEMPPKAPSKKNPADPPEAEVPTMNPNVLLYLQAASRAFPRVENSLQSYSARCDKERKEVETNLEATEQSINSAVKKFSTDRKGLVEQLATLDKALHEVRSKIDVGQKQFQHAKAQIEETGVAELKRLEAEVQRLRRDADEAAQWALTVKRKKEELKALNKTIEDTRLKQEGELKALHDQTEAEKRKLRDSLVRKLRRARDQLTSSTDDEISGKIATAEDNQLLTGSTVAPSAKQNEKLSREVTMYERDCESVKAHNQSILKEEEELQNALKSERSANGVLVIRNASHVKAKRILTQQLKEVQQQFVEAMSHHQSQHSDRVRAFRDTVSTQANLLDDLQSELELHLTRYEEVKRKVKAVQTQMAKHDESTRSSQRFLTECRRHLLYGGKRGDPQVENALGHIDALLTLF